MQNPMGLAPALCDHLTTIKLALQLLERERSLTEKQRALVQVALAATDDVLGEASAPEPRRSAAERAWTTRTQVRSSRSYV
jgi:hypothetical protein